MKLTTKTITLGLIFFFCFLGLTTVLAQETAPQELDFTNKLANVGTAAGFGSATQNTLPKAAGIIINTFLSILGLIFMGYLIYAGYLWLTAAGKEESLTKAKAIIRGSIIGLIIVLGAYSITTFVLDQVIKATGYTK